MVRLWGSLCVLALLLLHFVAIRGAKCVRNQFDCKGGKSVICTGPSKLCGVLLYSDFMFACHIYQKFIRLSAINISLIVCKSLCMRAQAAFKPPRLLGLHCMLAKAVLR